MDVKEWVGGRIKTLRRIRGYSQERLAEIADVNPKYLSSIERGKENPTLDFVIRWAAGLRVSIQEVFYVQHLAATQNPSQKTNSPDQRGLRVHNRSTV
jgi:transcriptional regulator with XRE-family HTH domain